MQPHDTTPTKVCTKCGESKPATTEYFRSARGGRYGVRSQCRICEKAYWEASKERMAEYGRVWHFANRERILQANKERYAANRDAVLERSRAYYASNKERVLERTHAWFVANKERHHELTRAWYAANKEKHNERIRLNRKVNKDRYLATQRAYRAAHPEVSRLGTRRYRARKVEAEGTHTDADIQAQYKRQRGKCYYCGVKVGDTYHVDHVVPLSRGGSDDPGNLVIACVSCNTSKSDKLPHEWARGGRLL